MRLSKEQSIPVLSETVRTILTTMSRSRSISSSLCKRAEIVLLASEGKSNQEISKHLNMHYNNVATWRTRFISASSVLQTLEESDSSKLKSKVTQLLTDNPRSGCPPVYTQEQIVKIIDLACKSPTVFGYEASHWSLNMLVLEITKQGIAEHISAKSVSRFLKGSGLKTS